MRDPRGLLFKHVLEAVLSGAGLIASTATVAADERSAISLPGDRAFPESITSTPDGTVYVGSLGSGAIFRAKPRAGDAEVWIQPGTSGGASIFGVLADARSSTLWACSNDLSAMGITIQGAAPGSWLESFDLRTGETKARVQLPGEHALCNDIAIGRDGSVFVTNSNSDVAAVAAYVWAVGHAGKH